jgi:endonuclease/exonuclease/phosphatase family metal-dependent hydrolase
MQLRVMTYNVRYFAHVAAIAGLGSTKKGIDGITKAIANIEALPHVICLQEVETRSLRSKWSHTPGQAGEKQIQAVMKSLDRALEAAGREHRYVDHYFPVHGYRVGKADVYTTGLAVLVRKDFEVLDTSAQDITHRRFRTTARLKQSRSCAHVAVKTPNGELIDIFNTHLSLPSFISRDLIRIPQRMGHGLNQAKEIAALADFVEAKKQSDRYLIAGDFNSLPGSPAYNLLLERLKVNDPFPESLGSDLHKIASEWPTAGFMRFRMRLDHIFVGPGLRWIDFSDSHPFGALGGHWHGLSDHVPILGRFDLSG